MISTPESTFEAHLRIISDAGARKYADLYTRDDDKTYVLTWARARTKKHHGEIVAKMKERGLSDGVVEAILAPTIVMAFILTDADMQRGEHNPRRARSLTGQ